MSGAGRTRDVSVTVKFKRVPRGIGTARLVAYTRTAVQNWSGGMDPDDPLMGATFVTSATAIVHRVGPTWKEVAAQELERLGESEKTETPPSAAYKGK
jgi:hypothetical protein